MKKLITLPVKILKTGGSKFMFKDFLNGLKEGRMSSILITLGIVAAAAAIGIASQFWSGDDNAIEEQAEKMIEKQIGVDIDLSPGSEEK